VHHKPPIRFALLAVVFLFSCFSRYCWVFEELFPHSSFLDRSLGAGFFVMFDKPIFR